MKKIYGYIIVAIVTIMFLKMFTSVDFIELIIEQNEVVQVVFYILVTAVIAILMFFYIKKDHALKKYKNTVNSMKTSDEFEKIYKDLKMKLENEFKNIKKRLLMSSILLIISMAFFLVILIILRKPASNLKNEDIFLNLNNIILVVSGIGTATCSIIVVKLLKKYNFMYKHDVIGGFIKQMNSNLEYNNKDTEVEKIIKKQYLNSGFEVESVDTFYAEDFIIGNLNKDTYISIADVHVQKDENIEKQEALKILFDGLFAVTTINKSINATIKILNDEFKIISKDTFIKMDSSEMEKRFDIYSTNKMIVMRLFTPETMKMINDFYTDYNVRFEIIIENNLIYFRFYVGNMFETRLIEDPFKKNKLFLYYTTIKLVLDLTEKFNENVNELYM